MWYGENYEPRRVAVEKLSNEEELLEDGGRDGEEDGDELY